MMIHSTITKKINDLYDDMSFKFLIEIFLAHFAYIAANILSKRCLLNYQFKFDSLNILSWSISRLNKFEYKEKINMILNFPDLYAIQGLITQIHISKRIEIWN